MNAAYYLSLMIFNLAYLCDASKYYSPFLWLISTRIRRLSEADYRAIEQAKQTPTSPSFDYLLRNLLNGDPHPPP